MEEEVKKHESIRELLAEMYDDFKQDPEIMEQIKTETSADKFAIGLHDTTGRLIRNNFLWSKDTEIYKECVEKGFDEPDDCSHYILKEFFHFTKHKLMAESIEPAKEEKETKNNTEESNESEEDNNPLVESDGYKLIDWFKLKKLYPLAMKALEDWLLLRFYFKDAKVQVEQFVIMVSNGESGVYVNIRDLYDFFDAWNIRPFITPQDNFPMVRYIIQSKKSTVESDNIYDERSTAEINAFVKCFFYVEVTIEHDKVKIKK